jgi:hypothetical protein
LTQIIHGGREFKFILIKGIALLQGEIIVNEKKYTENFQNRSSPVPAGQIQSNWYKLSLGEGNPSLFK